MHDGIRGLVRGECRVELNNHEGRIARIEAVAELGRKHVGRDLDTQRIGYPEGIADMRHLLNVLQELIRIGGRHALDDYHGGCRRLEGVLEQLFALYRADVLREVGEYVVVRAGADVAEQGRNQQQDCDKEYETGFFGNAFC